MVENDKQLREQALRLIFSEADFAGVITVHRLYLRLIHAFRVLTKEDLRTCKDNVNRLFPNRDEAFCQNQYRKGDR